MIGGGNGVGHQDPPFCVFPGKKMSEGLLEGASAGVSGTMSESGLTISKSKSSRLP